MRYPGLKEEYYLADHVIDDAVLDELGLDRERLLAVVRPPPEVTLYHRGASTDLFAAVLARLLAAPGVQTVVLPAHARSSGPRSRGGRRSCPSARSTGRAWWPPPISW